MTLPAPTRIDDIARLGAQRFAERTAFRFLDENLSYAQFEERVGRLASTLAGLGVGRGDRVGVYLTKSLECAVAIYGAMRAGAAYVPLDPHAPLDRIAGIIADCGISVLITHPVLARKAEALAASSALSAIIGASVDGVHCLDWDEVMAAPHADAPPCGAGADDMAYIMFTSGSTGLPKGIVHTHRSGMAYATMAAALHGLHPEDRLANISPLHFDMSTLDYFAGPLCGAQTTIISEGHQRMPGSLAALVENEGYTIWYSVPFALTQMMLHGGLAERDVSRLRLVIFAGEPISPKHLAELTRLIPHAKFGNAYGPAEVNLCTFYELPGLWKAEMGQPPVGPLCPGARALVLGADDAEVPFGEEGELVVSAPTMTKGYWKRDDLNAGMHHRRMENGVERLYYRTGDIVVETPTDGYRLLGRKDRQIKARGYRVELDEVEEVLASHPSVEDAGAYPFQIGDGPVQIGASVVLLVGHDLSAEDLARHAASKLPPYACPAKIDLRQDFPRTGSGKIDRRALRQLAEAVIAEDF